MNQYNNYHLAGTIAVDEEGRVHPPLPDVNTLEINLSQLARNYHFIRGSLKLGVKLLVVLKGNAYGHGLVPIASELERLGCEAFGVVRLNEAYSLREAGIKTPILLMAPFPRSQASQLVECSITPMVDQKEALQALEKACLECGRKQPIHIKVNTGLNRYGIAPEEALPFLKLIKEQYPHLIAEGIYTHFQNPDYNSEFTREQLLRFLEVIRELNAWGLTPPVVHAGSSTAVLKYPEAQLTMVRCGVLIFCLEHTKGEKQFPTGVDTLMTLKGRILKIRVLKPGEYGGYGNQFIAAKETRVAIIGLGYGDGISRGWKEALVAGTRVPVINYFMDAIMADISEVTAPVGEFDEAVLIGRQGQEEISWGEVCKNLGTYEDEQIQYLADRVVKSYIYDTVSDNS